MTTADPLPTRLQIQTTTGCGAACQICPHPIESPHWSNGLMSDAVFERVVEVLQGLRIDYLAPYLMADPMSDRRIFDRIERLRQVLPDAYFELSTTGLYLNSRIADRLLDCPLNEVRISSHGISAEEWARTMPGINYDRAWPNLLRFVEAWKRSCRVGEQDRTPYKLSIVSLWGLWITEREAEIDAFWRRLGVDVCKWQVISRADQVDLTVFGGKDHAHNPRKSDPPYACESHRDTQWLHILSDGRVTLCCMDYRHEAIIGNIMHQSIEAIWNGESMQSMRKRIRGTQPCAADFLCNRCEWHVSERRSEAVGTTTARAERV